MLRRTAVRENGHRPFFKRFDDETQFKTGVSSPSGALAGRFEREIRMQSDAMLTEYTPGSVQPVYVTMP